MEPQVFAPGGVEGELVVLSVVAAHQYLKAIGGSEPQEICRLLALITLLVVFQVALTLQLCPDLVEGRFAGSRLHLVEQDVYKRQVLTFATLAPGNRTSTA